MISRIHGINLGIIQSHIVMRLSFLIYWITLLNVSITGSEIIDNCVCYMCLCVLHYLITVLTILFFIDDNLDNQIVKYENWLHRMMGHTLNSRNDFL